MAALAFLVATRFRSILAVLGLSSEIMAEGLFIPGIAMIWLRDKRPLAGGISLALGGGFAVAGFLSRSARCHCGSPSGPSRSLRCRPQPRRVHRRLPPRYDPPPLNPLKSPSRAQGLLCSLDQTRGYIGYV
jgi:hypothetical protein